MFNFQMLLVASWQKMSKLLSTSRLLIWLRAMAMRLLLPILKVLARTPRLFCR